MEGLTTRCICWYFFVNASSSVWESAFAAGVVDCFEGAIVPWRGEISYEIDVSTSYEILTNRDVEEVCGFSNISCRLPKVGDI